MVFRECACNRDGDKDLTTFFHVANSLHRNFYGNEMKREPVEIAAVNIEQLIAKLKRIKYSG